MRLFFPFYLRHPTKSAFFLCLFFMCGVILQAEPKKPHFWHRLQVGKDYLADEVVIQVQPDVSKEQIVALGKSLGCKLVKKIGTLNFYQFTLLSRLEVEEIRKLFLVKG